MNETSGKRVLIIIFNDEESADNNLSNLQFDFHNGLPLRIKVKINLVVS